MKRSRRLLLISLALGGLGVFAVVGLMAQPPDDLMVGAGPPLDGPDRFAVLRLPDGGDDGEDKSAPQHPSPDGGAELVGELDQLGLTSIFGTTDGGLGLRAVDGGTPAIGSTEGPKSSRPDPGAVVQGSLSKDAVTRVFARNRSEVRFCLEQTGAKGKLTVKVVIGSSGKVLQATVTSNQTSSEELGACLTGRIRKWEFPPPTGGGIVVVSYPFLFAASGDDPKPGDQTRRPDDFDQLFAIGANNPKHSSGSSSTPEQLSASDIMAVVVANKPSIQRCVALAAPGTPTRTQQVRWKVLTSGVPADIVAVDPPPGDAEIAACLEAAVAAWRFPPHRVQGSTITFPFRYAGAPEDPVAHAETPPVDGGAVTYTKSTTFDFEDDTIEGDLVRPDGTYVEATRPPPSHPPPEPRAAVHRFPTIEAPVRATAGVELAVMVSLTSDLLTPEVAIKAGQATDDGQLALDLPEPDQIVHDDGTVEEAPWIIDVAFNAPGLEVVDGKNLQPIELRRAGDSTLALFKVRADAVRSREQTFQLMATFWHRGVFLARVARPITITPVASPAARRPATDVHALASRSDLPLVPAGGIGSPVPAEPARAAAGAGAPVPAAGAGAPVPAVAAVAGAADEALDLDDAELVPGEPPPVTAVQGQVATISEEAHAPDLTVYLEEGLNPARPDDVHLLVASPWLATVRATQPLPPGLSEEIRKQYATFARRINRGLVLEGEEGAATRPAAAAKPPASEETVREDNIALMRGFGRQIYAHYAPEAFKGAIQQLRHSRGAAFRSIQIYTNSPRIPWELMIVAADGELPETDFLGIEFRVARWHISSAARLLMKPDPTLEVAHLFAVAPAYEGKLALASQQEELAVLQSYAKERFSRLDGTFASVKSLVSGKGGGPRGLIHFAGHGRAPNTRTGNGDYELQLVDRTLSLQSWRGMVGDWRSTHPLVFLNACDLGQAHQSAGFVDGWAPAVLEAGASGFIGGLWPLGDAGAADFVRQFYGKGLEVRSGNVADALRFARRKFHETGDPTYLAYVFYGDTELELSLTAE